MRVVYTPKAKKTLKLIYDFLIQNWGKNSAENFLNKTDELVSQIAKQPFMFKATAIDFNVRIATITKQTSLFYEVKDDMIVLLFFYDNRQDPVFK